MTATPNRYGGIISPEVMKALHEPFHVNCLPSPVAPDVVELKSSEAFKRYVASHRALLEELAAELGIPASVLESRGTR